MDKLFAALVKLLSLAGLFGNLGVSKEMSIAFSGLISIMLVISLTALFKYLADHYKNSKVARDLAPYFNYHKVKASRKFYIPTKFQNESPAREDEPGFIHKFVAKNALIPFFTKIVFNEKKDR
jgi:hypothetical protein